MLPSVDCLALQYFPTLSHKRNDFRRKVIEHKMCVSSFLKLLSGTFLILWRNERDMIKNAYWSSNTRYSCQILMKLEFSGQTFEKCSNIKFHENPSSRSRDVPYGRIDRRTDMMKLMVAFRSFAKAPKKSPDLKTLRGYKRRTWNTGAKRKTNFLGPFLDWRRHDQNFQTSP